jgi:alpha-glucosidase (family GH31 glycosyl hydrolase)
VADATKGNLDVALCPVLKFVVKYLNATRDALVFRAKLLPYIYTMYKIASDTGLIISRPMYYSHPKAPESYDYTFAREYMFGDSILVAPVFVPMDQNQTAPVTVWFPPIAECSSECPRWFALDNPLESYVAGSVSTLHYPLSRIPAFAPSGAILTLLPTADAVPFGAAGRPTYPSMELWIFPATFNSETWIYEDDGFSSKPDYVNTTISVTRGSLTRVSVKSQSFGLKYPVVNRPYSVRLIGARVNENTEVMLSGNKLPKFSNCSSLQAPGWCFDSVSLMVQTLPTTNFSVVILN